MIRVLLADDHDLFRAGVRSLLSKAEGIEVVGEAGDGREAVRLAAELRPDVVLLDVMMPRLNGLEAAALMPEGVRVIILSMNSNEEYVLQALRAGASGYVLKTTTPEDLDAAIRTVAAGRPYLSSCVSQHVITAYLQRVGSGDEQTPFEKLTPRLRQVLQLIAEGRTTKEIAKDLGITPRTAETYRERLMDALDVRDVAGLVRYAIKMGIISID